MSQNIKTRLEEMKYQEGIYTYPDHKAELINTMVILILLKIIPNLNDVEYLKNTVMNPNILIFFSIKILSITVRLILLIICGVIL